MVMKAENDPLRYWQMTTLHWNEGRTIMMRTEMKKDVDRWSLEDEDERNIDLTLTKDNDIVSWAVRVTILCIGPMEVMY